MPKKAPLEDSTTWLTQSSQLLAAYPSTTRITTKYTIKPPPSAEALSKKRKRTTLSTTTTATATNPSTAAVSTSTSTEPTQSTQQQTPEEAVAQMTPRANITLKTFEPGSGICLKYKTDKEREVGRLIASLAKLGRQMATLPGSAVAEGGLDGEILKGDVEMAEENATATSAGTGTEKVAVSVPTASGGASAGVSNGGAGGRGAKKKKKGKR